MVQVGEVEWQAGIDFRNAERQVNRFERNVERGAEKTANIFSNVFSANLASDLFKGALDQLNQFVRGSYQATVAFQRFGNVINFATGRNAELQIRKIRDFADELGVSAEAAAEGFASIANSVRGTSLERDVDKVFKGIIKTFAAFGISAQEQSLALLGLSQLASGGTVNMEDLRQVVDRIPSGMATAAKSMNLTAKEFKALVSTGNLAVEEFLPNFIAELENTSEALLGKGEGSVTRSVQRLENALSELQVEIGQTTTLLVGMAAPEITGAIKEITNAFSDLRLVMSDINLDMEGFTERLVGSIPLLGALGNLSKFTADQLSQAAAPERAKMADQIIKEATGLGPGASVSDISAAIENINNLAKAIARRDDAANMPGIFNQLTRIRSKLTEMLDAAQRSEAAGSTAAAQKRTGGRIPIGFIGGTPGIPESGRSSGPHLHFEIRVNGKAIDPNKRQDILQNVFIGGKPMMDWVKTSGYRTAKRPGHQGIDLGGANILGQPIDVGLAGTSGQLKMDAGGYGLWRQFTLPTGEELRFGHLHPDTRTMGQSAIQRREMAAAQRQRTSLAREAQREQERMAREAERMEQRRLREVERRERLDKMAEKGIMRLDRQWEQILERQEKYGEKQSDIVTLDEALIDARDSIIDGRERELQIVDDFLVRINELIEKTDSESAKAYWQGMADNIERSRDAINQISIEKLQESLRFTYGTGEESFILPPPEQVEQEVINFEEALRGPMQGALRGLFSDVARGTASIEEVFLNFLTRIADRLADFASRIITDSIFGNLFNQGPQTGPFGAGFGSGIGSMIFGGLSSGFSFGVPSVVGTPSLGLFGFDRGGMIGSKGQPVPIMAHVGEQILSTINGDAQMFRSLKQSGQWDVMKSRGVSGQPFTIMNINTRDADSFHRNQSRIAQMNRLEMEKAQRFK